MPAIPYLNYLRTKVFMEIRMKPSKLCKPQNNAVVEIHFYLLWDKSS